MTTYPDGVRRLARMFGRAAGMVLLLLLAFAPADVARAAGAVEGELSFAHAPVLRGGLKAAGHDATLDLAPDGLQGDIPLTLTWISGTARLVSRNASMYGAASVQASIIPREFPLAAGALGHLACEASCEAILMVDGKAYDGTLAATVTADGVLASVEASRHYQAMTRSHEDETDYRFVRGVPAGALAFGPSGADGATGATAEGRVLVFLQNATVRLDTAEGPLAFSPRWQVEAMFAPGTETLARYTNESFLVLDLEGVAARLPPDAPHMLYATDTTLRLDGSLVSSRAAGWMRAGGERHDLDDRSLEVDGRLVLDARAEEGGTGAAALLPDETVSFVWRLDGDADDLRIAGASVLPRLTAPTAAESGLLAAALAALGTMFVAFGPRGLLLPLYSRISPGAVLANGNRRRVLNEVLANPGRSVTDLVTDLGMARAVVQHHLSMLVAHELLVARRVGRAVGYFPPGIVPGQPVLRVHGLLRDPTRRRIVGVLSTQPCTQSELVAATGLSQSVVSYHLLKLESQGLLVSRGEKPRVYGLAEELAVVAGAPDTAAAAGG